MLQTVGARLGRIFKKAQAHGRPARGRRHLRQRDRGGARAQARRPAPEGAAHRGRRGAARLRRPGAQEDHLRIRPAPDSGQRRHRRLRLPDRAGADAGRAARRVARRGALQHARRLRLPDRHATLDVFDLPAEANSGAKGTCFAIATRGDASRSITNTFERHFRRFDVIDIPELCQRNLAALLPQDAKGVAFLLIRDDFAQLVLTRNRMLYVTRRFDFRKRGELNGDADEEANELPLDPQMLSLELQRSLDYYESHFDESAIADLFIAPAGIRANLMAAELGASTGLRISMFNIHDLVDVSFSAEIPDGWLPCMAIGAAHARAEGLTHGHAGNQSLPTGLEGRTRRAEREVDADHAGADLRDAARPLGFRVLADRPAAGTPRSWCAISSRRRPRCRPRRGRSSPACPTRSSKRCSRGSAATSIRSRARSRCSAANRSNAPRLLLAAARVRRAAHRRHLARPAHARLHGRVGQRVRVDAVARLGAALPAQPRGRSGAQGRADRRIRHREVQAEGDGASVSAPDTAASSSARSADEEKS